MSWFGWGKKEKANEGETGGSNAVRVKSGEENTFYYNEELKSWCNKGEEAELRKKLAEKPAPPPTATQVSASQSESEGGFTSAAGRRKNRYAMTPGMQMSSAPEQSGNESASASVPLQPGQVGVPKKARAGLGVTSPKSLSPNSVKRRGSRHTVGGPTGDSPMFAGYHKPKTPVSPIKEHPKEASPKSDKLTPRSAVPTPRSHHSSHRKSLSREATPGAALTPRRVSMELDKLRPASGQHSPSSPQGRALQEARESRKLQERSNPTSPGRNLRFSESAAPPHATSPKQDSHTQRSDYAKNTSASAAPIHLPSDENIQRRHTAKDWMPSTSMDTSSDPAQAAHQQQHPVTSYAHGPTYSPYGQPATMYGTAANASVPQANPSGSSGIPDFPNTGAQAQAQAPNAHGTNNIYSTPVRGALGQQISGSPVPNPIMEVTDDMGRVAAGEHDVYADVDRYNSISPEKIDTSNFDEDIRAAVQMALNDTAFLNDSPDHAARRARKKRRKEKRRQQQAEEAAAAAAAAQEPEQAYGDELPLDSADGDFLDMPQLEAEDSMITGVKAWLHQVRHEDIHGNFNEDAEVEIPINMRIEEQVDSLKEADLDLDRKVHENFCPPTIETSIYKKKAPAASRSDSIRSVLEWIKSRDSACAHDLPAVITYFIEAFHNVPDEFDQALEDSAVQLEQNFSVLAEACACLGRMVTGNRALLTKIMDEIGIDILFKAASIYRDCAPHVALLLKAHFESSKEMLPTQRRAAVEFLLAQMATDLDLVMPLMMRLMINDDICNVFVSEGGVHKLRCALEVPGVSPATARTGRMVEEICSYVEN